jgi:hypothetical protein
MPVWSKVPENTDPPFSGGKVFVAHKIFKNVLTAGTHGKTVTSYLAWHSWVNSVLFGLTLSCMKTHFCINHDLGWQQQLLKHKCGKIVSWQCRLTVFSWGTNPICSVIFWWRIPVPRNCTYFLSGDWLWLCYLGNEIDYYFVDHC